VSTLMGIGIGFLPIDPIKALFWSAVINGVISIPIMVVMMLMAGDRKVMGKFVISSWLKWLGWATAVIMAVAVAAMFWTMQ
jgi:Mn2+/Fe2+ NRAMP family transporter